MKRDASALVAPPCVTDTKEFASMQDATATPDCRMDRMRGEQEE